MYKQLFRRLKNENLAKAAFSSPYEFIASYPWGTPERTQVINAYRHVQKQKMLVSLILTGILLLSSLFTKDRKLCDTLGEEEAAQSDEDPMLTWALRIFRRFSFKKEQ
ncbi:Siderophore iron transporter ARN1 [Lachancea thermotolerans]